MPMVEREEVHAPTTSGNAVVTRIVRQANGKWSVEFDVNFEILVGDGRRVYVRKFMRAVSNEQRGRKRHAQPQSAERA